MIKFDFRAELPSSKIYKASLRPNWLTIAISDSHNACYGYCIWNNSTQALKHAKKDAKGGSVKERVNVEKKKKAVERLNEQLEKLEISATDKEENKQIALGTSKLNYLDPRISVGWCKANGVPIEKVSVGSLFHIRYDIDNLKCALKIW